MTPIGSSSAIGAISAQSVGRLANGGSIGAERRSRPRIRRPARSAWPNVVVDGERRCSRSPMAASWRSPSTASGSSPATVRMVGRRPSATAARPAWMTEPPAAVEPSGNRSIVKPPAMRSSVIGLSSVHDAVLLRASRGRHRPADRCDPHLRAGPYPRPVRRDGQGRPERRARHVRGGHADRGDRARARAHARIHVHQRREASGIDVGRRRGRRDLPGRPRATSSARSSRSWSAPRRACAARGPGSRPPALPPADRASPPPPRPPRCPRRS